MEDEIKQSLKERAFRELGRRDAEGSFLKLNYQQALAFKRREVAVIRPIADRELKRYKRLLWVMGLSVPLLLAGWLYFNLFRPALDAGTEASVIGVGISALWAVISMAYALTMALPRIAALERASALLDVCGELAHESADLSAPQRAAALPDREPA